MLRYLALINYTDKGVREARESLHRASEFRAAVQATGGKVLDIYWAIGEVDGIAIFEVANEEIGASVLLNLSSQGFVRTRTLRVYNEEEFKQILAKL